MVSTIEDTIFVMRFTRVFYAFLITKSLNECLSCVAREFINLTLWPMVATRISSSVYMLDHTSSGLDQIVG